MVIQLLVVLLVTVAVVVLGSIARRRTYEQIARAIEAMGGSVESIRFARPGAGPRGTLCHAVTFVSQDGDVRYAVAMKSRGHIRLFDETPYQVELERDLATCEQPLRDVLRCARVMKLPGHAKFEESIRALSKGSQETITVNESVNLVLDERPKGFAAVHQCVLATAGLVADEQSGTLDLMADGKPVLVHWRVEGVRPHRSLTLSTTATPAM